MSGSAPAPVPDRLLGRLERFRDWQARVRPEHTRGRLATVVAASRSRELADRLAAIVDGAIVDGPFGIHVRRETLSRALPLDRDHLACLPEHPPRQTPLVCLDTETTGLRSAAGTFVFLVGLGRWDGDRFRQVQLLLPDQSDEPAFLAALAAEIPGDAWLVTYNGRGFDWPLLVTRYRMGRRAPPKHGGHLDLLPFVRRLFRYRLTDARLRTVEGSLLGIRRGADVEGWEIPGRYLDFLRTGAPEPLRDVVDHNDQDVQTLGRLVAHIAERYGDRDRWADAPSGDLAGLARAYRRADRPDEALACLDTALGNGRPARPATRTIGLEEDDWWSPRQRPDFGGRAESWPSPWPAGSAFEARWPEDRLLVERARLLRRTGRVEEAIAAWQEVALRSGSAGVAAWVEIAKVHEHVLRDPRRALEAAARGCALAERRRQLGWPVPRLEGRLVHRVGRLRRRLARRDAGGREAKGTSARRTALPRM